MEGLVGLLFADVVGTIVSCWWELRQSQARAWREAAGAVKELMREEPVVRPV